MSALPASLPTLEELLGHWPQGRSLGARLAGGLRARGVRRGDRVAWQLPNDDRVIALYRACWRLGAVAVPLHHRVGPAELAGVLAEVGPAVVLASWDELDALASSSEPYTGLDADLEDDAVVLFTAGSTGAPKGVRHTHRSLAYKARSMVEVHGLRPEDVVLMPAPLAHISGLLNGVLVPGAAGMASVLMPQWSPQEALDLIERHRVSFMVGPPTFFVDLMESPAFRPAAVASLRLVSSGGAGVAPAFVDRATEQLGAVVKRSYGSTEAPTVATSVEGDDPALVRVHDGHPVGQAELRLDDGGQLLVRGPELFAGYLSPQQTRAAMVDGGWFQTGDLAVISADGWLTITGRLKALIIRGGENISIAEVERILEEHPAVRRAAVLGEPDERLGERVVAVVVAPGGFDLEECRGWFARRGVARFKTPERVVVVDELPVSATGKLDRAALRSLLSG
ncbi:class I adenylate-forming enzyme family protein [Rhabdothermincola sediminis]|uniref:class I adenylate-forming enzyme family protein n=1 Tax=Rhabdothermincola sediminis TaxID=2751370 RepID=UPI001AA086E8|nr:AMP-binding protein [Rhabdothermincola sediminis]